MTITTSYEFRVLGLCYIFIRFTFLRGLTFFLSEKTVDRHFFDGSFLLSVNPKNAVLVSLRGYFLQFIGSRRKSLLSLFPSILLAFLLLLLSLFVFFLLNVYEELLVLLVFRLVGFRF